MTDLAWTSTGDGSPVLLVMGFGMRGAVWRPVVQRLAPHHQTVTFDHRGIGESPELTAAWTMASGAEDALSVLDAAGHQRAHIVGVSMGGMVAQELALLAPRRVASLSLVATSPGGPVHWLPPRGSWRSLARVATARSDDDRHRAMAEVLFPPGALERLSEVARKQRRDDVGPRQSPRTIRAQLRAVHRHDTRDRLGALAMPTLVVKPGRDRLVGPERSDQLAAAIPRARLVTLPDAGHGLILTSSDTLCDALLSHLAAHPA